VENGLPVEHFIELVPLRKADASTINETLTDRMKKKGLVIGNIIGMGQQLSLAGTMENSPHSIFVHCHCHLLQLACVQAANNTQGIKRVYTTILWKYFHYSPKWAECLKEIQQVVEMPEIKIVKPSDI